MPSPFLTFVSEATLRKRFVKIADEAGGLLVVEGPDAESIHCLRRQIKKLRAWLRLVRGCRIKGLNKADRMLRQVAREFSAARDHRVLLSTFNELREGAKQECPPLPLCAAALARRHVEAPALDPALRDQALALLERLKERFRECCEAEELVSGLRHSYARARRLHKVAKEEDSAETLHQLRKWVKYLGNQLDFVSGRGGEKLKRFRADLNELASQLGKHHDLVVLEEALHSEAGETGVAGVAGEPGGPGETDNAAFAVEIAWVERESATLRASLLKSSRKLAEHCFKPKAREFTNRIATGPRKSGGGKQ